MRGRRNDPQSTLLREMSKLLDQQIAAEETQDHKQVRHLRVQVNRLWKKRQSPLDRGKIT